MTRIPLKNKLGEIKIDELFLCDQPDGYFAIEMFQSIAVHKECVGLAEYVKCRAISDVY